MKKIFYFHTFAQIILLILAVLLSLHPLGSTFRVPFVVTPWPFLCYHPVAKITTHTKHLIKCKGQISMNIPKDWCASRKNCPVWPVWPFLWSQPRAIFEILYTRLTWGFAAAVWGVERTPRLKSAVDSCCAQKHNKSDVWSLLLIVMLICVHIVQFVLQWPVLLMPFSVVALFLNPAPASRASGPLNVCQIHSPLGVFWGVHLDLLLRWWRFLSVENHKCHFISSTLLHAGTHPPTEFSDLNFSIKKFPDKHL